MSDCYNLTIWKYMSHAQPLASAHERGSQGSKGVKEQTARGTRSPFVGSWSVPSASLFASSSLLSRDQNIRTGVHDMTVGCYECNRKPVQPALPPTLRAASPIGELPTPSLELMLVRITTRHRKAPTKQLPRNMTRHAAASRTGHARWS